jgi:cardiolipin synthase
VEPEQNHPEYSTFSQVPPVSSRIFTIPNILSFLRLLLVPVFLVLIVLAQDGYALLVLVVSSITDYLDGILARRLNQVSRLGQLLDPAADRLFIFAALIGLAVRGVIPWWLVAIIVGRDVMLLALGITLANFGYGPLPVHHLGKVATFCLFYALPILMIGQAFPAAAWVTAPVGWAFALWGAFLYWWAGFIYLAETVRLVRIPRVDAQSESDTLGR